MNSKAWSLGRLPWAAAALAGSVAVTLGCGSSATGTATGGGGSATASSSAPLTRPVMGYVWDRSASALRPVHGVSGAAVVGAPLFAGRQFTAGVASARRGYALLTDLNGQVELATLPSGTPAPLTGQLSPQQQVALSPSGNNAVLYAPDAQTLVLVQGLPGAPALRTLPLPSTAAASRAAVGDDGTVLVASIAPGGSASLIAVRTDGSSAAVGTLTSVGGLGFVPRTANALVADAGTNTVLLFSGLNAGTPKLTTLAAGSAAGIQGPVAVAASADGRWGLVANAGSPSVVRLPLLAGGAPLQVRCSCSPIELRPMLGNDVFLLTEPGTEAMTLFDGDATAPRTVFVAGLQTPAAGSAAR